MQMNEKSVKIKELRKNSFFFGFAVVVLSLLGFLVPFEKVDIYVKLALYNGVLLIQSIYTHNRASEGFYLEEKAGKIEEQGGLLLMLYGLVWFILPLLYIYNFFTNLFSLVLIITIYIFLLGILKLTTSIIIKGIPKNQKVWRITLSIFVLSMGLIALSLSFVVLYTNFQNLIVIFVFLATLGEGISNFEYVIFLKKEFNP